MPCTPITIDGKPAGFICSRGSRKRCTECGKPAAYLCDWKPRGKKAGKTCDRGLCASCATSPAPDKHLCRPHADAWKRHPKNTEHAP